MVGVATAVAAMMATAMRVDLHCGFDGKFTGDFVAMLNSSLQRFYINSTRQKVCPSYFKLRVACPQVTCSQVPGSDNPTSIASRHVNSIGWKRFWN